MARLVAKPTVIPAAGQPPKLIEEFIGRVNSANSALSIAKMTSPSGWREAGQTPEFDEFTIVLRGQLQAETRDAVLQVSAGQALIVNAGEWVRYSTPGDEGAEYVAVCLPAFSPDTVHRDE
jgi:mannose-6-phosphate isomerase-like protein (cupin superfamily)